MHPQTAVTPRTSEQASLPYVLPFVIFFVLLAASPYITPSIGMWEYPLRTAILAIVLFVFSRHVIDLRARSFLPGIALGVAVFVLWIAPDVLIPGYRNHWLFQNSLTGELKATLPPEFRSNFLVLGTRALRAIILVPIIEELFWRAWLMRWLINPKLDAVPLGAFTWSSMIITAVLFASEHGPYWDVGLLTGFIYNWWMVRTKSLGDCILVHAVTNACLSAYVIATGRWEYWF